MTSTRRPTEILIRRAYADDATELARLAALDSADGVPGAPLLVAELDGELRVALSLADGSVIADPFVPTAEVIALLRLRAAAETPAVKRMRFPAPSRRWNRAPRFSAP
jgi:hypothetical protein